MRTTHYRWSRMLTIGVAAALLPLALRAQAPTAARPIQFGFQGGLTLPTGGDYGDVAETGWNVGGFLQWRPENQVFGLRGELQYHRNPMKEEVLIDNGASPDATGNFSVLYVGVAPVLEVAPPGSSMGWYILAGVGMYTVNTSISESGVSVSLEDSKIGVNAGAGLRFRFGSSASLFLETRYHGVKIEDANFTFLPLSVGIVF